jgi:SAM-dependent methyltransferase
MKCRHCQTELHLQLVDLGYAPPSNAYLTEADLRAPEQWFPLRVLVCHRCWLVQTEDYARFDELFKADYAYFSSTSRSWLAHTAHYTKTITQQLQLDSDSFVIEVASNDGYLLKNFVAANIPCLGIEPTAGTARAAEQLGIPVLQEFFTETLGHQLAAQGQQADLVIGNNVYAHVPDINDFTKGLKAVLKPGGIIALEFPHLLELLIHCQFDTIYHEHFSYLSLGTVQRIFAAAGLKVWHVEQLPTHGGSLRILGCHAEDAREPSSAVAEILAAELQQGLQNGAIYQGFQERADRIKNDLVAFLIEQKRSGKSITAYGAAAKGNTLLNYGGIKPDLLPYVCDAAAAKQGKYLPGSHIPILSPHILQQQRPDYVLILPWNITDEVIDQNCVLAEQGTQFVTAVPELKVWGNGG